MKTLITILYFMNVFMLYRAPAETIKIHISSAFAIPRVSYETGVLSESAFAARERVVGWRGGPGDPRPSISAHDFAQAARVAAGEKIREKVPACGIPTRVHPTVRNTLRIKCQKVHHLALAHIQLYLRTVPGKFPHQNGSINH